VSINISIGLTFYLQSRPKVAKLPFVAHFPLIWLYIYIYIYAPESHRRLSHRLVFFVEYMLQGQNIRRKEKKTCAHEPPYYGLQSQKSKFKISQDFCLPHVHLSLTSHIKWNLSPRELMFFSQTSCHLQWFQAKDFHCS
jgi:hypothetical protein